MEQTQQEGQEVERAKEKVEERETASEGEKRQLEGIKYKREETDVERERDRESLRYKK